MAIAFRASSAASGNFASASPAVTLPAAAAAGDFCIIGFGSDTTHVRGGSPTLNGFADQGVQDDAGSDGSCSVLCKILTAGDISAGTLTFTNLFAASESGVWGLVCYSGVNATTPLDVATTKGTGAGAGSQLSPAITPTTAGAWVVAVRGSDPGAGRTWVTSGSPASTERLDAINGTSGFVYIQDYGSWTSGAVQLGATPNASEGSAIFSLALRPAGATAFDLDAQPGSYALTGAVARLARDIPFNAGPGTYTLTGFQARVARDIPLNAAPGAYALTGSAAGLISARMLSALAGSYALTGSEARLARDIPLNAAPGSYALTGLVAGLIAARVVNAGPGAYSIAGAPATLARDIFLNAAPGAYVLAGFDAELLFEGGGPGAVFDLDAQPGSYALTGVAASLVRDISLDASSGVYALTGQQAALLAERVMNAAPGSYALTGAAAALLADRVLKADPGGYSVTGFVAGLIAERSLNAAPGSYIIVGSPATLIVPGAVVAEVRPAKWYVSRPGFYG